MISDTIQFTTGIDLSTWFDSVLMNRFGSNEVFSAVEFTLSLEHNKLGVLCLNLQSEEEREKLV